MKAAKGDRDFFTADQLADRLEVSADMVRRLIWVEQAFRPAVQLRSNPQHDMPNVQLWRRSLEWGIFEYPLGKFEYAPTGWVYLDLDGSSLHDQSEALEGPGSCIGVLDTERRSYHQAYGPVRFQDFDGEPIELIFCAKGEGRYRYAGDEMETLVYEFWLESEADLVVPLEEVRRYERTLAGIADEVSEGEREGLMALIGLLVHGYIESSGNSAGLMSGSKPNAKAVAESLQRHLPDSGARGLSVENIRKYIPEAMQVLKARFQ